MDFEAFPKIPRLKRQIVITEKLDGANAQIGIAEDGRIFAGSTTPASKATPELALVIRTLHALAREQGVAEVKLCVEYGGTATIEFDSPGVIWTYECYAIEGDDVQRVGPTRPLHRGKT